MCIGINKIIHFKCKNSPFADCFANDDLVTIDDFVARNDEPVRWRRHASSGGVIASGAYRGLFNKTSAKQSADKPPIVCIEINNII